MIEYTVSVRPNGDRYWYINGELYKVERPRIEWINGIKEWHINGKRYREEGPDTEWPDGNKVWFINGERITEKKPNKKTKTKKLTVAEISELLGYDVEVVKE